MTQKIVINNCYGGFGLSKEGILRYFEIKGAPVYLEYNKSLYGYIFYTVPPNERQEEKNRNAWHSMSNDEKIAYNERYNKETFYDKQLKRDDPILVQVVEELGDKASDRFANLKVVEIPDDVEWEIDEYDGVEQVEEVHRKWG